MDASTSASTPRASLKRKAATLAESKLEQDDSQSDEVSSGESSSSEMEATDLDDLDDGAHNQPMDADDDDKDEQDEVKDEVEEPVKKKARKVFQKKVAVWQDLQGWKEGEHPLGRFPLEVLDLIINVDADLDLRDHLALSATCRYFRACYTDLVFQVLFESKYPNVHLPVDRIIIRDTGAAEDNSYNPNGYRLYTVQAPAAFRPFHRSWNEARWIFSSSRIDRDGWAVPTDQWTGSDAQQAEAKQAAEFSAYLTAEREKRRPDIEASVKEKDDKALAAWKSQTERFYADQQAENRARHARGQMLVLPHAWEIETAPVTPVAEGAAGVRRMMEELLALDVQIYGERIRPSNSWTPSLPKWQRKHNTGSAWYVQTARDPWASPWRKHVADIVNKPRISRTAAKSTYKVSDGELEALKMTRQNHWSTKGAVKWFYLAAVQALSLRSHGGVNGHKEVLTKAEERKKKAHATKVKNGTLKVAKPKKMKWVWY